MALLKQSDLLYKYKWSHEKKDNPDVRGFPDSVLLDRDEGYEVLPFFNKFGDHQDLAGIPAGLKVERMIHDHLPSNVRSHANVEKWLTNNWQSYK